MNRNIRWIPAIMAVALPASAVGATAAAPGPANGPTVVSDVLASANVGAGAPVPIPASEQCPVGVALTPDEDCSQIDVESEPAIAVNPSDPANVIATMQVGRFPASGDSDNGYAVSFDAGRTWQDGAIPGLTKAAGGSAGKSTDPIIAFGPDGTVYAAGDALPDENAAGNGIAVSRSFDDGRTWQPPVIVGGDRASVVTTEPSRLNLENPDKPSITVDDSHAPGHTFGRVYLSWSREGSGEVLAAYSDDHGATWNAGMTGTGYVVDAGLQAISTLLVLRSGGLGVVLEDSDDALLPPQNPTSDSAKADLDVFTKASAVQTFTTPLNIVVAPPTPGGQPLTFGPPATVAWTAPNSVQNLRDGTNDAMATAAADGDGRMFVAWADLRNHVRLNSNGSVSNDGLNDVLITSSGDNGRTWTVPTRVNPPSDTLNRFDPVLAVSPNGTVAVAYRQREEAGGTPSRQIDTELQISTDHGSTFGAPVRVNAVSGDSDFAGVSAQFSSSAEPFLGDYFGLAATRSRIYVAHIEAVNANQVSDCPAGATSSQTECAAYPPLWHHQRLYVAAIAP